MHTPIPPCCGPRTCRSEPNCRAHCAAVPCRCWRPRSMPQRRPCGGDPPAGDAAEVRPGAAQRTAATAVMTGACGWRCARGVVAAHQRAPACIARCTLHADVHTVSGRPLLRASVLPCGELFRATPPTGLPATAATCGTSTCCRGRRTPGHTARRCTRATVRARTSRLLGCSDDMRRTNQRQQHRHAIFSSATEITPSHRAAHRDTPAGCAPANRMPTACRTHTSS